MPSLRLYPLLVTGAACLALAACGDDDPASTQAGVPAQTEAAPAETAPSQAPATTAPDGSTSEESDAPAAGGSETTPATPPSDAPSDATEPSQGGGDSGASGSASDADSDAPAKRSSRDSKSSDEATKVRQALITVQEAFAAKDGKKACAHMVGIPKKTDPKRPGLSCESLSQGPKSTLSEENRKIAANAKVTIDGNKATAELGPGVPLELRKVDGRWRVDYSNLTGGAPSPR